MGKVKPGHVELFAGTGEEGDAGNDNPSTEAKFGFIESIAVAGDGTVYIGHNSFGVKDQPPSANVRRVGADGIVHYFLKGYEEHVAVDGSGNVYCAGDFPPVQVVPLNGEAKDYTGKGNKFKGQDIPVKEVELQIIEGVAYDRSGHLYICDEDNIWKIDIAHDTASLFAEPDKPKGVAVDTQGNVYTFVWGMSDQPAQLVKFSPQGKKIAVIEADTGNGTSVTVDGQDNVYYSISPSSDRDVVKMLSVKDGQTYTVAGGGKAKPSDGAAAIDLNLWPVKALAATADSDLYIGSEFQVWLMAQPAESPWAVNSAVSDAVADPKVIGAGSKTPVKFTWKASAHGPGAPARDALVVGNLPAEAVHTGHEPPEGTFDAAQRTVTWKVGALAAPQLFEVRAEVTASAAPAVKVEVRLVQGANASADVPVQIETTPALQVDHPRTSQPSVPAGQQTTLSFSWDVVNKKSGPVDVSAVTATLPANASYVSCEPAGATFVSGVVTWPATQIKESAGPTYTVKATVQPAAGDKTCAVKVSATPVGGTAAQGDVSVPVVAADAPKVELVDQAAEGQKTAPNSDFPHKLDVKVLNSKGPMADVDIVFTITGSTGATFHGGGTVDSSRTDKNGVATASIVRAGEAANSSFTVTVTSPQHSDVHGEVHLSTT